MITIPNIGGIISTTAVLHLMAGLRNGKIVEHFNDFADKPVQQAGHSYPTVVDGHFNLPEGPGWGVELNVDFLQAQAPQKIKGVIQDPGLNMFIDANWSKRGSHHS